MSADLRPDGREPHCDQDFGGSHYHCARCGEVSGMSGHWRGFDVATMRAMEGHMCCPGDCANPEAHPKAKR